MGTRRGVPGGPREGKEGSCNGHAALYMKGEKVVGLIRVRRESMNLSMNKFSFIAADDIDLFDAINRLSAT